MTADKIKDGDKIVVRYYGVLLAVTVVLLVDKKLVSHFYVCTQMGQLMPIENVNIVDRVEIDA